MIFYTTWGSVRGDCGHVHRTLDAAIACLERDRRQCSRLGGGAYSDRHVRELEAATVRRARYLLQAYYVTAGPGRPVNFS